MLRPSSVIVGQKERMLEQLQVSYEQQNVIKSTISKEFDKERIDSKLDQQSDNNKQKRSTNIKITISNRIIEEQMAAEQLTLIIEDLRFQEAQIKKQTEEIRQSNESIQLENEQINSTIKRIKSSIQQLVSSEKQKLALISQHFNKSFQDIQTKISNFQKQSIAFQKDNQQLKEKKKSIEQKLNRLQTDYRKQSQQKDSSVRIEKEQLIDKLQSLEIQVSQVTELNKEYSTREKSNFDKKLSLYLKVKKFPQYSSSFLNSAKTIQQCQEQLLKGIQRLNDAKQAVQKLEKEGQQIYKIINSEMERKNQKQAKIESLKKEKEIVRDKIICLQNKIKQQKLKNNDPSQ